MRLTFSKKVKSKIQVIKTLFILIILIGCQSPKNQNQNQSQSKNENNYSDKYFYLAKDEYAHKDSEGNVLLHLSEEDSIFVNPEKVCSLHLYPNWERKEFPNEVFEFPNLKYLWVAMRDFKTLPNELVKLKKLEHIDLQHSGIKRLPDNLGEFKKLKELVLLFSNIEILPLSICEVSTLKTIDLGATKINTLPPCLNKLKNLEEISLFKEDESEISDELRLKVKELQKQLKNCKIILN